MLERAARRAEPVAVSSMSLLEIAVLRSDGKLNLPLSDFFDDLQANPLFRLLPLTYEIALEVATHKLDTITSLVIKVLISRNLVVR